MARDYTEACLAALWLLGAMEIFIRFSFVAIVTTGHANISQEINRVLLWVMHLKITAAPRAALPHTIPGTVRPYLCDN